MTEIDKLIEQEAKSFRRKFESGHVPEVTQREKIELSFVKGANFVLSHITHQNRWRKISDELPSVREEKYQIVLRIIGLCHSSTIWTICNKHDIDMLEEATNWEWKPID